MAGLSHSIVIRNASVAMKMVTLMLCSVVALRADFAPDSISGKIYRESIAPVGLAGTAESTIHFVSDNRYTWISSASVSAITDSAAGGRVVLRQPPPDGRYVYRKTSDALATIELTPDSGASPLPKSLTFTGPNFGGDGAQLPRFSFWLTDATALGTAPAINISMRGRVAEGRPLVVGFVIPGPAIAFSTSVPPAGALQREVLIRVVGGATLRQFGITDGWVDPDFEIFSGPNPARFNEFKYSDWSKITYGQGGFLVDPSPGVVAGLKKVFMHVGAFALADDSKDAVGLLRLTPGAYTVIAAPRVSDLGGEVLVEVYFLP